MFWVVLITYKFAATEARGFSVTLPRGAMLFSQVLSLFIKHAIGYGLGQAQCCHLG